MGVRLNLSLMVAFLAREIQIGHGGGTVNVERFSSVHCGAAPSGDVLDDREHFAGG